MTLTGGLAPRRQDTVKVMPMDRRDAHELKPARRAKGEGPVRVRGHAARAAAAALKSPKRFERVRPKRAEVGSRLSE